MIVANQGKTYLFHGDDLNDVADWLEKTPRLWATDNRSHFIASQRWDLGAGYEGAWRLAREGWSEGARDIETGEVSPLAAELLKVRELDIAGAIPDVGRFLGGEPKHMINHRRRDRPTIHLALNLWTSGGTDSSTFVTYGRAMLALVDQLEAGGHRVELDVFNPTSPSGGYTVCVGWKVKRAADALDLGALAFSIAHPAAFRRIGFAMYERSPRAADDHGGYGSKASLTPWMSNMMDLDNATLLPSLGIAHGINTKQTNARLREHLATAGIAIRLDGE